MPGQVRRRHARESSAHSMAGHIGPTADGLSTHLDTASTASFMASLSRALKSEDCSRVAMAAEGGRGG